MLKLIASAALLAIIPTITLAQTPPSPTKALVNIIVAEQFCAMRMPPQDIIKAIGGRAALETGLDTPQLVEAGYLAATDIGNAYRADGRLAGFCAYMAGVYSASGWR